MRKTRFCLDHLLLPAEHAFLDRIIENVDDDTPRLVYADWLEENGEPYRADIIRRQIQGESMTQIGKLIFVNYRCHIEEMVLSEFCDEPGQRHLQAIRWTRGFISGLEFRDGWGSIWATRLACSIFPIEEVLFHSFLPSQWDDSAANWAGIQLTDLPSLKKVRYHTSGGEREVNEQLTTLFPGKKIERVVHPMAELGWGAGMTLEGSGVLYHGRTRSVGVSG